MAIVERTNRTLGCALFCASFLAAGACDPAGAERPEEDGAAEDITDGSVDGCLKRDEGEEASTCDTCQPNATQACWNGSSLRVCNSTGTAFEPKPCTDVSADTPFCSNGQCVTCVADACADSGSLLECVGGSPMEVTCAASQTCFQGSCVGECRYTGTNVCVSPKRSFHACGLDGSWGPESACGGTTSGTNWDVCRDGTCVAAAMDQDGFTSTTGWSSSPLAANVWRVGTITMTKTLVLFDLAVFLSDVVDDGRTMRLAIWEDADLGGRQPGALLAQTEQRAPVNGQNVAAIDAFTRPTLQSGKTYWIGVVHSVAGASLVRRPGTGDITSTTLAIANPPESSLNPFPDVSPTYDTTDYAFFVQGKPPL